MTVKGKTQENDESDGSYHVPDIVKADGAFHFGAHFASTKDPC